jgi:hypothetical protein
LKINFKDNCVTGTFTLMHHIQVAPNALHLVMAIETQYRQSLSVILNATRVTPSDPPGLRRLRFPSFNSIFKEQLGDTYPRAGQT